MQGRMAGRARSAARKHRIFTLIAAAAAVPVLLAWQSVAALAAPTSPAAARNAATRHLTAALAAQLSRHVDQHVIVIMKHQLPAARAGSHAAALRSAATASLQAPLLSELRKVHATHIKTYRLIDALAATVSKGEVARLKASPAVAKVIPDVTIHGAAPLQAPATGTVTKKAIRRARQAGAADPALTPNNIPGACSATTPQLDPEGLALTNTDSDNPSQPTAR